jgi:ribosomal protein S18 acetylase RimI-like enzyme
MSPTSKITLIPASAFSFEELTEAYNHTRVDYLVPMPMNSRKLKEYVENYDIDMDASAVAVDGNEVLGLAMLGVREKRAWLTRLGVIRSNRRRGTGTILVDHLLDQAHQKQVDYVILEVIKDNAAAHHLFLKKGFALTRELLVLSRPPSQVAPPLDLPKANAEFLNSGEASLLLEQRQSRPSWVDEKESLLNAGNLSAIKVSLANGGQGWLVYQNSLFQISRLVIQTEAGNPVEVGRTLLYHLHQRHPFQDTKTENLPADDPHWPAFKAMGYMILFPRLELILPFNQLASVSESAHDAG